MVRRFVLAWFALAAVFVAACGHQVTPSPTGSNSNLAGHMLVRFRTNAAFNFNSYVYAIVIDNCGHGTPYPNAYNSSFFNYSFSFLVGGAYGSTLPALEQYILTPGSGNNNLNPQNVPLDSSLVNYIPNSNSQNTEFTLTFDRALLNNPKMVAQPCPGVTPAPSAAASPTSTVTATPSPTATATSAGSASPTSTPTATATPTPNPNGYSSTWNINFFTLQGSTVLDSLGQPGAQDTSEFPNFAIDTNTFVDITYNRPAGSILPSDPAAQLAGGEIVNYP